MLIESLFCGNSCCQFITIYYILLSIITLKMECILCPDRLNMNQNVTDTEREYWHWKITFENFIDKCQDKTPNKLRCFVKNVTATIYDLISVCHTYESALNILDRYFI